MKANLEVKGNTFLKYAIDLHKDKTLIAVCAPCVAIYTNTSLDTCCSCGYYLAWTRTDSFSGQGVRTDYIKEIIKKVENV